jgi:hypothetical protein
MQTSMSWKKNMNTCTWGQTTGCAWGREGREEDKRTQITCIHEVSPARHGLPLIISLSSLDTIRVWDSEKRCVSFHPASYSINSKWWAQNKHKQALNRHKQAQPRWTLRGRSIVMWRQVARPRARTLFAVPTPNPHIGRATPAQTARSQRIQWYIQWCCMVKKQPHQH